MPFFPPFIREYRNGDLVYGLGPERDRYFQNRHKIYIDHYLMTRLEWSFRDELANQIPRNQTDFRASVQKHHKYNSLLNGEFHQGHQDTEAHRWNRKSKAGLSWAAEANICVHFILDGINQCQVVNKTHGNDIRGTHKRSFTGVELRWVYRNRHAPRVQRVIQFWEQGRAVLPPWEGNGAALWANYRPVSKEMGEDWSSELSLLFNRL